MLLSWVIQFAPLPVEVPIHQARALESIFLEDWIARLDATYARELHEGQTKPFTLSDLQGRVIRPQQFAPEGEGTPPIPLQPGEDTPSVLAPNQPLFWRITSLAPRLSELILNQVIPILPEQITLKNCGLSLPVHKHSLAELPNHRWAGHNTYQEIIQRFLLSGRQPSSHLKILFASPTAFKKDGNYWLFPSPENVVESWLRRWNAFSPITFPEVETKAFAAQSLVVNRYRLQTLTVQDEELQIGFRGECSFRFLNADPYWMRVIATLAAFSFYCGTGIKTARGMGQTRQIYENYRARPSAG